MELTEKLKRVFECGRNYQLTGENNFNELLDEIQNLENKESKVNACEFAEWLSRNRWFNFDEKTNKWCYVLEYSTVMSDEKYKEKYMKTSDELYQQFTKPKQK